MAGETLLKWGLRLIGVALLVPLLGAFVSVFLLPQFNGLGVSDPCFLVRCSFQYVSPELFYSPLDEYHVLLNETHNITSVTKTAIQAQQIMVYTGLAVNAFALVLSIVFISRMSGHTKDLNCLYAGVAAFSLLSAFIIIQGISTYALVICYFVHINALWEQLSRVAVTFITCQVSALLSAGGGIVFLLGGYFHTGALPLSDRIKILPDLVRGEARVGVFGHSPVNPFSAKTPKFPLVSHLC